MRNLFLLITLFTGLSGFLILWDTTPEIFLRPITASQHELPRADSYMNGTESVKFAATGEKEYVLTTSKSLYFQDQEFWEAEDIHITAYTGKDRNHPWELKADRGELQLQKDIITLRGNVEGWQDTGVDERRRLTTSELIYHPKQKLARTDMPLTLSSQEGTTTATGMTADFSNQVFRLLENVKGQYRAP